MDEQSIWKKEISFRRKPKEKTVPAAPAEEPTSIWKKEISFKRKAKAKPVADTAPHEEPTSIWKKEISLKRKPKPVAAPDRDDAPLGEPGLPAAVQRVMQPIAETPAAEPVAETATVPEQIAEPAAPEPVAEPPAPEPVAETFAPEPVAETLAPDDPVVETPALEPVAEPWEAPAEVPPAPEPVSLPAEPVAEAPTIEVPAAPSVSPEPAPAPVAPDPAPAAVVHPPVPAAELPPLPEEKAVPFWKKDISFGKKPKAAKPAKPPKQKRVKAEKAPKAEKPKRVKEPKVKPDRGGRGGKKIIGLKVGASQLAAARVTNDGSAELLQLAREPLNPGIVVGGELRDPEALALALKEFFTKHKLPKKGVRLGIANNRIGVRTFDVVGIDDQKQLDNAIRFRAQEALPIPLDEAVLDYQVLGETTNEDGEKSRRVLLVVAYREQIDRYVDACKKAGIVLAGIDLEAFALLRALQAPQDGAGSDPTAALVAVAIGHERSTFAVSDGRVCEFTRVLEWGGSSINVTLARTLDAAPSEVEGVKRALPLTDESVPEGMTAEQAAKARDAMRRAIQAFARELVSSLQYYQNQPGSLGIGEIVLTGGTAHLPGLAAELERLIGVHVRVGDPLARIKVSKKVGEPEQIGSLAVAIGLGIED